MGLGGYPTVSLAMAREKASAARKALADGGDPFAKRNREAEPTFGEAAGRYVESRGGVWRNRKTCFQWTVALKGHCTPIWNTRVSDVDVRAVLAVLTPLWTTVPVSAARVRNRVELVLDFAKAHGWRSGENPARWRGGLAHLLPRPGRTEVRHYKALHYRDVPDLMARLCDVRTMSARALEFLILTAARSNEVRLMTWDEVDFSAATWTLPGTRMKSGRQHTIPLPAPVLDLWVPCAASACWGHMSSPARNAASRSATTPCSGFCTKFCRRRPPPCTASARLSATGPATRRILPARWRKPRWHTPSAARSSRLTGAAPRWRSAGS